MIVDQGMFQGMMSNGSL